MRFKGISPSMIISTLAGTKILLVSHFTTSNGLPKKPPAISSSSSPIAETLELLSAKTTGSEPNTIAAGADFSPRFLISIRKFQPCWFFSGLMLIFDESFTWQR